MKGTQPAPKKFVKVAEGGAKKVIAKKQPVRGESGKPQQQNKKSGLAAARPAKELTKKQIARQEALDENIDSDEIDSQSAGSQRDFEDDNRLAEFDEENPDRKRVRLAQQILKQTKRQTQGLQSDDSFDNGEDDKSDEDSFQGVIHAETKHTDAITRALQNDILKKRLLVFTPFADQVKAKHDSVNGQLEVKTLRGHTRCITSLQFCPVNANGRILYSASKDTSIIRWDLSLPESDKTRKQFLTREKTPEAHKDEVLAMSVNHMGKYLVTGSKDKSVKLWDLKKMSLMQTFAGHKMAVLGVKFGINSNTFCSVSQDRQFKMWDASEKAFIDTFFGHKADVNSIDAISADNFISCGFDRQVILWKTTHQSQLIFAGHEYSIDIVRAIDTENFLTASQDGSVALWNIKKKKPVFVEKHPHGPKNWITSLVINEPGSSDGKINAYKLDLAAKKFSLMFTIPCNGIVNDIQVSLDCSTLAWSEGDEHRLGRWIVAPKAKNAIKYAQLL